MNRNTVTVSGIFALMALLLAFSSAVGGAHAARLLLPAKADQSKGTPSLYEAPKVFKHFKQFSLYIPMKDGTKIATEVYLPSPLPAGKKVPTMFEQSRYWRVIDLKSPLNKIYSKPLSLFREQFISRGYAWVVTDTRGGGASTGERPWEFCPLDTSDSKEVMEWVLKQEWSDGKLGVIGHSYSGNLAEFSVLSKLPNIKAAAVLSSPFDLYCNSLRPGGMALEPFISDWGKLTVAFDNNKFPDSLKFASPFLKTIRPVDGENGKETLKEILETRKQSPAKTYLEQIRFKDDYILGNSFSHSAAFNSSIELLKEQYGADFKNLGIDLSSPSRFWKTVDQTRVPIYAGAGWFEGANAEAAVDRFINYTTPGCKLILGPWDHNYFNISPSTRGGPTRFKLDDEMLKFFDYHVRGINTDLQADSPVHYFTLAEEKWHAAKTFPPCDKKQRLYLSANKSLRNEVSSTTGDDRYIANAATGTGKKTRWDCMLGSVLLNPYPDRKARDTKLLVYETSPLDVDTRITGDALCKFFLHSNGPDCTLFAYLEDVSATGKVNYVTEGELLCGNHVTSAENLSYKSLMPPRTFGKTDYQTHKPGEIFAVPIGMLPVSYQFKKGHRIRVSIGSTDRDHFKPPADARCGSEFVLHYGDSMQSYIELPIDE